jgi:hypothetical protein
MMGLAATAIGGWLAYTEVTGVYEFYMDEQGELTYVVKAAVGITLASAILPYFFGRAIKRKRLGRAAMAFIATLLAVAVVFTAAVHRTIHPSDVAEASRRETARKLDAAKANVAAAEHALSTDQKLTATECKTGVGKECRGLATASRNSLQTTIELRTKLGGAKEPVKDSTPASISSMTGGRLSEQQVQTIQPLLVPISVSFLAGYLITVGIEEIEQAFGPPRENGDWRRWARRLWQWLRRLRPWAHRRKPAQPQKEATPPQMPPSSRMEEPEIPSASRVPDRPRPKLAVSTRLPIGAVLDFLHDGLEITAGPRTEMADTYIGYTAWCKAMSLRPMDVAAFVEEMEALCNRFGIRIVVEGDCHHLVDVQIAPLRGRDAS